LRETALTGCGGNKRCGEEEKFFHHHSHLTSRWRGRKCKVAWQRNQMAALDRMERGRLSEQLLQCLKDGQTVTWGPITSCRAASAQKLRQEVEQSRRIPQSLFSLCREHELDRVKPLVFTVL
jgi:hypothetical protein